MLNHTHTNQSTIYKLFVLLQALSFSVLVAACVAISDVSIDTTGATDNVVEMVKDSRSAAGFMIFVGLFVLLCELGLIVMRFLNFGAVNRFFLAFAIVVSILSIIYSLA